MPPVPGQRIQRFEVIEILGSGGMGTVVRARDPNLERDVAIKLIATPVASLGLSPETTLDLRRGGGASSSRDDLFREARMMARLSHPNVLPVYEVGLVDDAVFLVMEHIAGMDLARWLQTARSTEDVVDVFTQAGRGLAAAHENDIIHRDFKPHNVLVGRDGRVRVADFGLSRLDARGAGMRVENAAGTPAYMAPELWRNTPATTKSDVYAFAKAFVEALRCGDERALRDRLHDRGLAAPLREAILAALADDPTARPPIARLVTLLGRHRQRVPIGRLLVVVGAAAGAGIAVTLAFMGDDVDAATCEPDPSLFAGRYDDARAADVKRSLAALPDAVPATTDAIMAQLADTRVDVEHELHATCVAATAGQITADQAKLRTSCLERRAIELGARTARLIAHPVDLQKARQQTQAVPAANECVEMTAPAISIDRDKIAALYDRFVASVDLAVPDKSAEHTEELRAIEEQARKVGELELAARAQSGVATELRFQDKLAEADAVLQDIHKRALEMHASAMAADTLIERSQIATLRSNASDARSFALLAKDMNDKLQSPRMRARVHLALGSADVAEGNYNGAVDNLRKGLDVVAQSGQHFPSLEVNLRFQLLTALSYLEGRVAEQVTLARETTEVIKQLLGDRDPNYGVALNLLAVAHRMNNDLPNAVTARKQALAILESTLPATHSSVLLEHSDYGTDLWTLGELEEAHRQLGIVVDAIDHNQKVGGDRAGVLVMYAYTSWDLGRQDEAQRLGERALEEAIAQHGRDHLSTTDARLCLVGIAIETGRFDEAKHQIASVQEAYRVHADTNQIRLALLDATSGDLANARRRPRDGEKLARRSLATIAELHGSEADLATAYATLGTSLADQRKWDEAREALDASLALSTKTHQRADVLAALEVDIARTEVGLGQRAEGIARATRARAVFDKFRGAITARKKADAVLAGKRR
jgi:eukaryotic-like serine/threonine-protein kinase